MSGANTTNNDDDNEDLFAAIRRERAAAPPGEYSGELMVLPFRSRRAKTRGVAAFIKIYDLVTAQPSGQDTVPRARDRRPSTISSSNNGDLLLAWRATEIGVTEPARKRRRL